MYSRSLSPSPAAPMTVRGEPFPSVEDAWFWTMAALAARRDGARTRSGPGGTPRPCTPDDVVRCLDQLYRRRRLDLAHIRILRIWGERRMAPNPAWPKERGDARLWREALDRMAWPLRVKGIVLGWPGVPPAQPEGP